MTGGTAVAAAPARVVNLCFHGIGRPGRDLEPGEDEYWIGEEQYLRLLDVVVGRDDVRLSFDDGNTSDVAFGLPGLLERGLTATFFLIAGRLDTAGSLGAEDVAALVAAGMPVGAHGWTHRPWRRLPPGPAQRELLDAPRRLQELTGRPVTEAACPLGAYDRRALSALRRNGMHRVYTSDRRPARPDSWLQPRYSLRRQDDPGFLTDLLAAPRAGLTTTARACVHWVRRWR